MQGSEIRYCKMNRLLSKLRNYLESPYDPDVFTAMRMARDTIRVGLWVRPKTKLICVAEHSVCPFETYCHTAAKLPFVAVCQYVSKGHTQDTTGGRQSTPLPHHHQSFLRSKSSSAQSTDSSASRIGLFVSMQKTGIAILMI